MRDLASNAIDGRLFCSRGTVVMRCEQLFLYDKLASNVAYLSLIVELNKRKIYLPCLLILIQSQIISWAIQCLRSLIFFLSVYQLSILFEAELLIHVLL